MKKSKKDKQKLFGTEEWANYNVNCVTGCSHECKYCYAKSMSILYKRRTPSTWKDEKVNTTVLSKIYSNCLFR